MSGILDQYASITPCSLPAVTHAYLCVWLLTSEVSADYYSHPPGIVSLVMLTITFTQTIASHIHTHSTIIQLAIGSYSWQPVPCM